MMPYCSYKRCKHVADKSVGDIDTGDKDGYGKPWKQVTYVCDKHYKKILNLLGYEVKNES